MNPRFTLNRAGILKTLSLVESAYGLQVMRPLGLKSGTFYPAIHALVAQGFVMKYSEETATHQELGRHPRTYYKITSEGRKYLASNLARFGITN